MEGEIKALASLDVGVFKSVGYFRAGGRLREGVKYQRLKLKKLELPTQRTLVAALLAGSLLPPQRAAACTQKALPRYPHKGNSEVSY